MRLFVTGTDTDVGKTVFAAALAGAMRATYWKPVQAGGLERSDTDVVRSLAGLPPRRVLGEGYRLATACSPHLSAKLDGTAIDPDRLQLPAADPLVVEGAGGLLVPLTVSMLLIDLLARWRLPAALVARTSLGTINHTLLSLHALRSWNIPIIGVAFVGDPNPDSEQIICAMGRARRLGCLPIIEPLDQLTLAEAFMANFDLCDFQ